MKFKCKCGHGIISEVLVNACISSDILDLDEDGYSVLGAHTINDGTIDRYQCARCGQFILDSGVVIKSPEHLYKWLKKKNMIDLTSTE